MYTPTENDIRLLKAPGKIWRARIEVLNRRFQCLCEIQGEALEMSLMIDAASDIRRTCTLTIHVLSPAYGIDEQSYFWLDKLIRVSYGLYDAAFGIYRYYPLGVYMLSDNSFLYSAKDRRLTLTLTDLMALATEIRGSAIGAQKTVIEVNSNIRGAMISVLTQFMNLNRYRIREFPSDQAQVPYDLEFSPGAYPYEVLTKLRDLYPCNQIYFDVDGIFVCEEIPSKADDAVLLDESVIDPILIQEERNIAFNNIRNVSEVWGQELDAQRTADRCETVDGVYRMTIPDIEVMDDGITYCLTPDADSAEGARAQVNELPACPIIIRRDTADGEYVDEPIAPGTMRAGLPYVLRYSEGTYFYWGELNVHGVAMAVNSEPDAEARARYEEEFNCRNIRYIVNPQDEFAIERIGMIRQVFVSGEYDSIYTSELAAQRAAYENWKSTRLQYTLSLEMLIVPWLDVGVLIRYTSPMTGQLETALVDSINMRPAEGTMTVELTRHYPYYPW